MRKTSQDGGDSTSITSGVENEFKKSATKPKKSSLKRKAPNFSHESDDTIIEPLLQKDKDITDTTQSAKYCTKSKTDTAHDKGSEKSKLLDDDKAKTSTTAFCGTTESLLSIKEYEATRTTCNVTAPLHNYMNTNIFNSHEYSKASVSTKSQILVEIDGSKQSGYSPNPLIFTTAKIHMDGKSKHMEPVQVTPVPILSTIEVSVSKGGNITTNEKKISNGSSLVNPGYSKSISYDIVKEDKSVINTISATSGSNNDTISKITSTSSTIKLATTSISSPIDKNVPSTNLKSLSTMSNTKNNEAIIKDIHKDQPSAQVTQSEIKTMNNDTFKNNVTVKTSIPLSGKVSIADKSINSNKSSQSDTKTDKPDKERSESTSSKSTESPTMSKGEYTNLNTKTPTTTNLPSSASNVIKNVESAGGSKQLQRQKTTKEDANTLELKFKSNDKCSEESSAKTSTKTPSTFVKVDSNINLPKSSANHMTKTMTKSSTTASMTIKGISTSTITKPTGNNVALSNTGASASKISTTDLVNSSKTSHSTVGSANAKSNTNNICTITSAQNSKTSPISSVKTTSKEESPEVSLEQPSSSTIGKSVPAKIPLVTTTETIPVSSDDNKAASSTTTKLSTALSSDAVEGALKISVTLNNKTANTTTPITSSIKASATNSVSSLDKSVTSTKLAMEASKAKVIADKKQPAPSLSTRDSIKTPSPASLVKVSKVTPSNSDLDTKQPITAATVKAKELSTVNSKKSTPVNSNSVVSTNSSKKSSSSASQETTNVKPSATSVSKISSVIPSVKTPTVTSTLTSVTKLQQQHVTTTKESAEKVSTTKKSPSVATKVTPFSTVDETSTKITSPIISSAPMTTSTKSSSISSGKTVIAKVPLVTTLTKTPTVTSTLKSVVSQTTTKPTIANTTQVSSIQSGGTPAVHSTSPTSNTRPPPKISETVKKGGSNSSDNNKDGNVSKA